MVRASAEPGIEGVADAVQASVRVGGKQPRRLIAGSRGQGDLGGAEQFRGADDGPAVPDGLDEALMVAAPAQVDCPDLSVAGAGTGGSPGPPARGKIAGAPG